MSKSRVEGMTWTRRGGKRGGKKVCHITHTITNNNNNNNNNKRRHEQNGQARGWRVGDKMEMNFWRGQCYHLENKTKEKTTT